MTEPGDAALLLKLGVGEVLGTGPGPGVWSADLPDGAGQVAAELTRVRASLAATDAALAVAEARLEAFLARYQSASSFPNYVLGPRTPRPEDGLERLLLAIAGPEPSLSYNARRELSGSWTQAIGRFEAYVQRLEVQMSDCLVETHSQGRLLARTMVSWTGDWDTLWQSEPTEEQIVQHRHIITLALKSRAVDLRTMIVVTRLADRLARLLSTPGRALLALPVALQFVQDLRVELELEGAGLA
jgi:hypothetical protein